MKKRQCKKNYKNTINSLRPMTEALTFMGWSFEDFGKLIPTFRNGKVISQPVKKGRSLIVKVQVAFNGDMVLIYDESHEKVFEQIGLSNYLKGIMGDDMKKFFYAEIEGKKLNILEEAPWQ